MCACSVVKVMSFMRPEIYLCHEELPAIRQAMTLAPRDRGAQLLAREISRAKLVPANKLPLASVRLNSRVAFLDNDDLEIESVQVVLPEAAAGLDRTSVTSLLGAALIGLRAGDTMSWQEPDGAERIVTVTRVDSRLAPNP